MQRTLQRLILAVSLLLPMAIAHPFIASADGDTLQVVPVNSKLFAGTLTSAVLTTPPLHAFTVSTKAYPISAQCDHTIASYSDGDERVLSDPQTCLPQQTLPIATNDVLQVRFVASASHCSDIAVDILVNRTGLPSLGAQRSYTGFLAPGASSQEFDLGHGRTDVTGLTIWATGRPGGCNTGSLESWSGTLYVTATGQ
jgi:hypothetical protein